MAISPAIREQNRDLSARVESLIAAERYPKVSDYSPALLNAVTELNAFYAAHPEIIVENKMRIRASRNRKFRKFRE
jgi:hypothetical protein